VSIHLSVLKNPPADVLAAQRLGVGTVARPAGEGAKRSVDISRAAQQLSNLQSGDADVNLAHVQALRAAIASGNLPIDTSRIADSLIASARELLK